MGRHIRRCDLKQSDRLSVDIMGSILNEQSSNLGATGGVPRELRDTAIWLTALTIFVYFFAERYLTGYLNYFGAESYWFDVSLPRLLMFSWAGIVYGTLAAILFQFVIALANAKRIHFYPVYLLYCVIIISQMTLSLLFETVQSSFLADKLAITIILIIVLAIVFLGGPIVLRTQNRGYNVMYLTRDTSKRNRWLAYVAIFAILFLGIPNSIKMAGNINAAFDDHRRSHRSFIDESGEIPTRILFTDGDKYLVKIHTSRNESEVRYVDKSSDLSLLLKPGYVLNIDDYQSNIMRDKLKNLAAKLYLLNIKGDGLPENLDELLKRQIEGDAWVEADQYRFDMWGNEIKYSVFDLTGDYTLRSAGPDEVFDSPDDIVFTSNAKVLPDLDFVE